MSRVELICRRNLTKHLVLTTPDNTAIELAARREKALVIATRAKVFRATRTGLALPRLQSTVSFFGHP